MSLRMVGLPRKEDRGIKITQSNIVKHFITKRYCWEISDSRKCNKSVRWFNPFPNKPWFL